MHYQKPILLKIKKVVDLFAVNSGENNLESSFTVNPGLSHLESILTKSQQKSTIKKAQGKSAQMYIY